MKVVFSSTSHFFGTCWGVQMEPGWGGVGRLFAVWVILLAMGVFSSFISSITATVSVSPALMTAAMEEIQCTNQIELTNWSSNDSIQLLNYWNVIEMLLIEMIESSCRILSFRILWFRPLRHCSALRGSLRASQAKQFQQRASLLRFFCERNLSADLYGKAAEGESSWQWNPPKQLWSGTW